MKLTGLTIALLSVASVLKASDDTASMLRAPRVRTHVELWGTAGSPDMRYSIDGDPIGRQVRSDGEILAIDDEVAFIVRDFNPLKQRATMSFADAEDPNFAQLKAFARQLQAFEVALRDLPEVAAPDGPAGGPATDGKTSAARAADEKRRKRTLDELESGKGPCASLQKEGSACRAFECQIQLAVEVLRARRVATKGDLERWVESALGRKGVRDVVKDMKEGVDELDKQISDAHKAFAALKTPIDSLTKLKAGASDDSSDRKGAPSKAALDERNAKILAAAQTSLEEELKPCSPSVITLSGIIAMMDRIDDFFVIKKRLRDSLALLAEELERDYLTKAEWRPTRTRDGGSNAATPTDLVVGRKSLTLGALTTATISFQQVKVDSTDYSIGVEAGKSVPVTFVLRRYQFLVPEAAGALTYTGLTRPLYDTAPRPDGTSQVIAKGNERVDLGAALFLNAVVNAWKEGWAYPMLQLGVLVSKDSPALCAGGGIRLTYPDRVGIAGGVSFGFFKQPGTLVSGQIINDPELLQKDLTRKVTTSWYLALQYHF